MSVAIIPEALLAAKIGSVSIKLVRYQALA
jgi:hypothetical protein